MNSRIKLLLWDVHVHFDCAVSSSSRLFYDDLLTFFSGSWHEDLGLGQGPLQVLVRGGPCMILYRSLWEDRAMLSEAFAWSCNLVQVLVGRSWRGPGEILSVSMHGLVQVLVRRSCGDPVSILLRRFLHSDLEDALRWCLSESSSGMLIGRSCLKILWDPLFIEGPYWTIFWIVLYVLVKGSGMRSWWVDIALFLVPKPNSCRCSSDHTVWSALLLFHSYFCLYLVHWFPTPHTIRRLLLV